MFQLVYDERESKDKGYNEVYILYYNNKMYYSMWLTNPVKVEICRSCKYMFINNLNVYKKEEREFVCEVFDFILQMKELLEIEGYTMKEITSSSQYYVKLYGKYI